MRIRDLLIFSESQSGDDYAALCSEINENLGIIGGVIAPFLPNVAAILMGNSFDCDLLTNAAPDLYLYIQALRLLVTETGEYC